MSKTQNHDILFVIYLQVKYESILKRFSISVVDKKLDLDLAMLKDKICKLFSFVSHADFTMTYVDEDGDVVCLDTDDELHEAVRQNLNPVRITIKLNSGSRYSPYHNPFNKCYGNTYEGSQTMPKKTDSPFALKTQDCGLFTV